MGIPSSHSPEKIEGDRRLFGNYRSLNRQTVSDSYLMPRIHDFTNDLQAASILTKIDVVRAFYSISIAEEDIPKAAATTLFGLFELVRMPFGSKHAEKTVEKLMDNLLRDILFA